MVGYKDRKYYNAKQKLEFFEYSLLYNSDTVVNEQGLILSAMRPIEEDYECDLCDFNLSYVKSALALTSKKSRGSNAKSYSNIMQYVNWCIANGRCRFGNESKWHMVSLDDIDMSYVINIQLPKSPKMLQEKLDTVYKLWNDSSTDSEMAWFYKTAFYFIYLGLTEEEVTLVKKSDVDFNNKVISMNGKTIFLDDYIISYIKQIIALDSVCMVARSNMVARKGLMDTPYLIRRSVSGKSAVSDVVSISWLRWNMDNFNKQYRQKTEEAISYTMPRLYDAGVFYKLYQAEKNGEIINLDFISQYYPTNKMPFHYGRLIDYNAWKKVYYE